MYFSANFCRICINSSLTSVDIESNDTDSIKLSEKLGQCMRMLEDKRNLSKKICDECIEKLRISYDFHNTCKKSNDLLQRIFSELTTDKIISDNFTNSDSRVTLTPFKSNCPNKVPRFEPNSILKSLLEDGQNYSYYGGMKNIHGFTKNSDFSRNDTPLSKLIQFSEDFFQRDFSAFQKTVLIIIENQNNKEGGDMFGEHSGEIVKKIDYEEVVIEPDNSRKKSKLMKEEDKACDGDSIFESKDNVSNYEEILPAHQQCVFYKSLKCRNKGNPYINPLMRKQFMLKNFHCEQCQRYFETPGYLKTHCAKVHNPID